MSVLDFVFYTFAVVVVLQVITYLVVLGKFAYSKPKNKRLQNLPVSVIVCAKNEAQNLKTFLPSIISQDYPEFEIVLINDASSDDTLEVMEDFKNLHSNIKIVDVKNNEAFWGNKKYALTLGIKASSHEYLLFTDADCKPASKHWIQEMTSHFNDKKSIVLGYGAYTKIKKSFLNKLIRFETLATAINYFSFAKSGNPYMGVGRNLAYTKKEFFKANGFIKHIKVRSGDDDLFVNQVATKQNTAICFTPDSFTESAPKTKWTAWIRQKRRHISTAKHYKFNHKLALGLLYICQVLFWILAISLSITTFMWPFVVGLIVLRFAVQYSVYGASAKKLNEKDLLALLPLLEIFLISVQLVIFIKNLTSKPNHWK
ncbi:glycosyltransferase [Aestuariibaculum suncheonense]|uniref:Glycosyltransferase n=1 Tax=Aestuariibaculum suncheonense TaxID=1028745 RepID=A0A8J6QH86_9FLAO|nr:glycosyltransferase [Aestuariibaculum suncheonense]MBD0836435.1 glycosyltransferase [Aestuariibaculum suncheonense]